VPTPTNDMSKRCGMFAHERQLNLYDLGSATLHGRRRDHHGLKTLDVWRHGVAAGDGKMNVVKMLSLQTAVSTDAARAVRWDAGACRGSHRYGMS
jgi:hypothetical protein